MIQDLSGSWGIKGTDGSTLIMDSPVPLMHNDPDRSWITDPDPDHPKGTHPWFTYHSLFGESRAYDTCSTTFPVECYLTAICLGQYRTCLKIL